ncbi:hypothetical protein HK102_007928 [Quaeritorhiza haematococci]|nr:hypothetical protein HK102_007928 [Quaeritorhiza haematococci]
MGRTNPIALRIKGLLNWPSNVRHPFLSAYIKHIFQDYIVGEPGIRCSTSGIWVNVTLFNHKNTRSIEDHPIFKSPLLDFRKVKVDKALGRFETRIHNLFRGKSIEEGGEVVGKKEAHPYYGPLTKSAPNFPLAAALEKRPTDAGQENLMRALQIYSRSGTGEVPPVHLKINVVSNPLQSADILAQYVAREMTENDRALPRIYKTLLKRMAK